MKIEELFKKAEEFFVFEPNNQEKKEKKKDKLEGKFNKKINSLKRKIINEDDEKKKKVWAKQLDVLKKVLKKIKE